MGALLPTLVVLIVLLGVASLAVRFMAKTKKIVGGPLGITVIERAMIGQGQVVAVVEIGSQILILGAGAGGVSRLGALEPEELATARRAQSERRKEVGGIMGKIYRRGTETVGQMEGKEFAITLEQARERGDARWSEAYIGMDFGMENRANKSNRSMESVLTMSLMPRGGGV